MDFLSEGPKYGGRRQIPKDHAEGDEGLCRQIGFHHAAPAPAKDDLTGEQGVGNNKEEGAEKSREKAHSARGCHQQGAEAHEENDGHVYAAADAQFPLCGTKYRPCGEENIENIAGKSGEDDGDRDACSCRGDLHKKGSGIAQVTEEKRGQAGQEIPLRIQEKGIAEEAAEESGGDEPDDGCAGGRGGAEIGGEQNRAEQWLGAPVKPTDISFSPESRNIGGRQRKVKQPEQDRDYRHSPHRYVPPQANG